MKKHSGFFTFFCFMAFALSAAQNSLPEIRINSLNGTNDFATQPVSHSVKEHEKQWYGKEFVNTPEPWYEDCNIFVIDGEKNEKSASGKVKVRGNWTTSYEKKSLRIKFDKKQNLLGLNSGNEFKNWVLLACYKDASLLRDQVALTMARSMFPDYYASDCTPVEVYINDEYWGVYLLAEQQEIKKNRINAHEADKDYTGNDIGYLIEFDMYAFAEDPGECFYIDYLGDIKDCDGKTVRDLINSYTIKSDFYSPSQKDFINDYMNKLWKICREASYNKKYYRFKDDFSLELYTPEGDSDDEKCKNCISNLIDLESLADTYIISELACDPDLCITSFLMDIDFGPDGDRKLCFEAPWDFDSTMGNRPVCESAEGLYAGKVGSDALVRNKGNPWLMIFIRCDWFKKIVKEQWTLQSGNGKKAAMKVISDSEQYKACYERNRAKWGDPTKNQSTNKELCSESKKAAAKSQKASADYLKKWLEKRFTSLDGIFSKW